MVSNQTHPILLWILRPIQGYQHLNFWQRHLVRSISLTRMMRMKTKFYISSSFDCFHSPLLLQIEFNPSRWEWLVYDTMQQFQAMGEFNDPFEIPMNRGRVWVVVRPKQGQFAAGVLQEKWCHRIGNAVGHYVEFNQHALFHNLEMNF